MADPDSSAREDFWIFRDGRSTARGQDLLRDLRLSLHCLLENPGDQTCLLKTLIQSGEFESALADSESAAACEVADLTSALADLYVDSPSMVNQTLVRPIRALAATMDELPIPLVLTTAPPEGFSYYALHPLDFARTAEQMADSSCPTAVLGVRSIGTTLSAVVMAVLKKKFVLTQRITVRPTGHPYDRNIQFPPEQARWIRRWQEKSARYLVVDEGPGRSGSTFLSVAEALVRLGVSTSRIILMGSVEPDPGTLRAKNAAARWQTFRYVKCAPSSYSCFSHDTYIGGGEWRRVLLHDSAEWPACWPQMERLKFFSADRNGFFKFEGLGRSGEVVRQRARCLAEAGFACPVEDADDGFALYRAMTLRSPHPKDVSAKVLERIAQYCTFRAAEFRAEACVPALLSETLVFNLRQEFGVELDLDADVMASKQPVLADARMQPYEWIRREDGELIKTDGVSHGDDHFFPGPCDIAWDLAGTAVEWDLHPDKLDYLLGRFRELSGIDGSQRIQVFILAYAVFRMAFCKMAAGTVLGTGDEFRLRRVYRYYRDRAVKCLSSETICSARPSGWRVQLG
jgi:hypothetical protein